MTQFTVRYLVNILIWWGPFKCKICWRCPPKSGPEYIIVTIIIVIILSLPIIFTRSLIRHCRLQLSSMCYVSYVLKLCTFIILSFFKKMNGPVYRLETPDIHSKSFVIHIHCAYYNNCTEQCDSSSEKTIGLRRMIMLDSERVQIMYVPYVFFFIYTGCPARF